MLVADDYHLEAGGKECRFALRSSSSVPSSVYLCLGTRRRAVRLSLGGRIRAVASHATARDLAERSADWFRRWTTEVASSSSVHMASFEEGLGRVRYVAGALEYERPFLGPLYRFMSLHPRDSVRAVPPYVSFFLRHLAAQISECRHHDCSMKMYPDQLAPRVEAQASADRTEIGGWYPHFDQSGQVNVKLSKWFSLEITRDEWPWVFEKSSKPALIISTLEALAVVVALKVYYGETPRRNRSSIRIVPTTTDNRGNGAALNKLMTTKYPASAVLMELAAYSKKMGLKASVEWSPREANREADALANGELSQFSPELRIPVDARQLQWTVLREALSHGKEAEDAYQAAKTVGFPVRNQKMRRKTMPEERLKAVGNARPDVPHPRGHPHPCALSCLPRSLSSPLFFSVGSLSCVGLLSWYAYSIPGLRFFSLFSYLYAYFGIGFATG